MKGFGVCAIAPDAAHREPRIKRKCFTNCLQKSLHHNITRGFGQLRGQLFVLPAHESGTMVVPMSFLDELRSVLGPDGLISTSEEVRTYECDGLTNFRVKPVAVVLPTSTEQVQAVLRICHRERIPFVARGSGTGLSGGALPVSGGIVISLAKMNHIL